MSDAVGELRTQAHLTRRVELDAGLLLQCGLLTNLAFEFEYFILLLSEMKTKSLVMRYNHGSFHLPYSMIRLKSHFFKDLGLTHIPFLGFFKMIHQGFP